MLKSQFPPFTPEFELLTSSKSPRILRYLLILEINANLNRYRLIGRLIYRGSVYKYSKCPGNCLEIHVKVIHFTLVSLEDWRDIFIPAFSTPSPKTSSDLQVHGSYLLQLSCQPTTLGFFQFLQDLEQYLYKYFIQIHYRADWTANYCKCHSCAQGLSVCCLTPKSNTL